MPLDLWVWWCLAGELPVCMSRPGGWVGSREACRVSDDRSTVTQLRRHLWRSPRRSLGGEPRWQPPRLRSCSWLHAVKHVTDQSRRSQAPTVVKRQAWPGGGLSEHRDPHAQPAMLVVDFSALDDEGDGHEAPG